MAPYFFRVEHDLLRSEAFKALGGSAVKVYLVIGLYSDFGTDWAYPSIRTIAAQSGLSRQTVLAAIGELQQKGLLATTKSRGRSTAYRILRPAPPPHPRSSGSKKENARKSPGSAPSGPFFLEDPLETGPDFLELAPPTGPKSTPVSAQALGHGGPEAGPKRQDSSKDTIDSNTIPIPGTPFQLAADGRLQVAVDLQDLLTDQGIPRKLAEKIAARRDPEVVAKVLLNAFYLQSQGKLQNGPGYIRAGIEEGYDLLPQVATRLEGRRRELEARLRALEAERRRRDEASAAAEEEAAIELVIGSLGPDALEDLLRKALAALPAPIVRRNPTLSNPFVRAKVYALACGDPLS